MSNVINSATDAPAPSHPPAPLPPHPPIPRLPTPFAEAPTASDGSPFEERNGAGRAEDERGGARPHPPERQCAADAHLPLDDGQSYPPMPLSAFGGPDPALYVNVATPVSAHGRHAAGHLSPAEGRIMQESAQGRARRGGHRKGRKNFNNDDIDALLDAVSDVEPIGNQQWARVAARYGNWARQNERPERDAESLKSKFDKLANTNKKTGDPTCPPTVRRAKHIARSVQGKASAANLGGPIHSSSDDGATSGDDDDRHGTEGGSENGLSARSRARNRARVGERPDKRTAGATGVPRHAPGASAASTNRALVVAVEKVVEKFSVMADAVSGASQTPIEDKIASAVERSMQGTNESIRELKELFLASHSSTGGE